MTHKELYKSVAVEMGMDRPSPGHGTIFYCYQCEIHVPIPHDCTHPKTGGTARRVKLSVSSSFRSSHAIPLDAGVYAEWQEDPLNGNRNHP